MDIAHCIHSRCSFKYPSARLVGLFFSKCGPLLIGPTALPWSNRWGLIVGIWIRSTTGIPYAVVMIWAANASAGHTKKTTVIALYHIGYGLGNIISPQLFRPEMKVSSSFELAWTVILTTIQASVQTNLDYFACGKSCLDKAMCGIFD